MALARLPSWGNRMANPYDQFDAGPNPYDQFDQPSAASDVLDTLLPSAAQAVTGIAGAPGDIEHLAKSGLSYLLDKAGYGNAAQSVRSSPQTYRTSEDYLKGLTGMTADQMYSPRTTAGELASRAIQFAPAMIGGPETALGKIAADVVPAAASLVGGKVAGPVGDVLGSLASPYGLKAASIPTAIRSARNALLTTPETAQAVKGLYNKVEAAGVAFKPEAYQKFVANLFDSFHGQFNNVLRKYPDVAREVDFLASDALVRPQTQQQVGSVVSTLAGGAPYIPPTPNLVDFADIKSVFGKMAADETPANAGQARLAGKIYGKMQDFWHNIKPEDFTSNTPSDPTLGIRLKQEADTLYKQLGKMEMLDARQQLARLRSGKNIGLSGDAAALKTEFGQLAAQIIKRKGPDMATLHNMSPAEEAQIIKTAQGDFLSEKILKPLSKLDLRDRFTQSLIAGLLGASAVHGGTSELIPALIASGAIAAPGFVGRTWLEQLTKARARKAIDMIHNLGNPLNYSTTPYPVGLLPPTVGLATQQAGNQ